MKGVVSLNKVLQCMNNMQFSTNFPALENAYASIEIRHLNQDLGLKGNKTFKKAYLELNN